MPEKRGGRTHDTPVFKMDKSTNTGICVPFWLGSGFKSSITALVYTANYKKKSDQGYRIP